jgi:hypothetical protein
MTYFYSYAIIPELKLIVCNFQGESTIDHIRQVNIQFFADPRSDSMTNLLLDFRHAVSIAYKFELFQYIDFLKKNTQIKEKVRVGFLIRTPNQKFLVTIYKPLARLLGMDVEYFETLEPCLTWMEIATDNHKEVDATLTSIKDKTIIYY